jgi:hypothetical protein
MHPFIQLGVGAFHNVVSSLLMLPPKFGIEFGQDFIVAQGITKNHSLPEFANISLMQVLHKQR